MSKCCCKSNLACKYLIPRREEREIIIMTDLKLNVGIVSLNNHAITSGKAMIELFSKIFVSKSSPVIAELVLNSNTKKRLIEELIRDKILEVTSCKPTKKLCGKFTVNKGGIINVGSANKPVKADINGEVYKIIMNCVTIYFFKAKQEMRMISESAINSQASVVMHKSTKKALIYPKISEELYNLKLSENEVGFLSSNNCSACSACGSCGLCVFCEEINFAVAAAAAVASTSATNF
ncbi:hypothetical protein [Clostridium tarantellae]|uniref:Uncharacterized protein n=1 Tax=Clostridium tarantellae TaxID=39493 RepID=A0A6I1MY33_9CLOT|nr:hypothetical protein [Clostridium tarantellae]MPQ45049.1 hypothetical protein [Clostridium tarantellae]